MKVKILCLLLIRLATHISSAPTTKLRRQFYCFVELLDIAQEVLKNSTDMQACMNEVADLAALVAKLKEEHAQALEERDLKHAGALSKLTEQINNLNGSLDVIAKQNKEQHVQLREAEEKLASHVDDMAALHDHVLGKPSICWK